MMVAERKYPRVKPDPSRTVTACRLCGSGSLEVVLDLGMQPLADAFVTDRDAPEMTYPLAVAVCTQCGFSQLTVVVHPEVLYQEDYPYEASVTPGGRDHFRDLAHKAVARFGFAGRLAVDIGANDGVLLAGLEAAGVRAVGIEPSPIGRIAEERGYEIVHDFFNGRSIVEVLDRKAEPAALITATNVFAHIDNLDAFMQNVDGLLARDGVLIIEAPHFLQLVNRGEYDTIYHEHLSYLTITPLIPFFQRHGFELFDVEPSGIHGGSIRMFVARKGSRGGMTAPSPAVGDLVHAERAAGVLEARGLQKFASRVGTNQGWLRDMVGRLHQSGKRIAGISAPAKGMTLINSCGIGPYLEFLTEKSGRKIGKFAPGSRLEVREDSALTEGGITHGLVLAWNFGPEIMRRQSAFGENFGVFIVPMPSPKVQVYRRDGDYELGK